MAYPKEPVAQPLPTGREDKLRLIMRTFDLTRKLAQQLLRDNGNDVNRALKSRNNITPISKLGTNTTKPQPNPKPDRIRDSKPIDKPNASTNDAPKKKPRQRSKNQASPSTQNTTLVSHLTLIVPLLSALQRNLATTPTDPKPASESDPKAPKKLSFYEYSVAHLPRSLSVLPPRRPPRVTTFKVPPPQSPAEFYKDAYVAAKKYPFNIFQVFLTRRNAMDVHVMGCTSREDAAACLGGYEQSFAQRPMIMEGGEERCETEELLGKEEWGFVVRVGGREVCKVVVVANKEVEREAEMGYV